MIKIVIATAQRRLYFLIVYLMGRCSDILTVLLFLCACYNVMVCGIDGAILVFMDFKPDCEDIFVQNNPKSAGCKFFRRGLAGQ